MSRYKFYNPDNWVIFERLLDNKTTYHVLFDIFYDSLGATVGTDLSDPLCSVKKDEHGNWLFRTLLDSENEVKRYTCVQERFYLSDAMKFCLRGLSAKSPEVSGEVLPEGYDYLSFRLNV